ncbi:WD40 repeat-like protein [Ceratobasidium sp. AG-I]|nr:WD40 repeat-like protein [Ceratobasidium sp. AG-I]
MNVTIHSIAISPDNTRIALGCGDQTVRIWNTQTGALAIEPLMGHKGAVRSVAFSSDGIHLVSGSEDCCLLVWDSQDGATLAGPLKVHTASVDAVAFSPDMIQVASGSSDNTACIWDAHTGICTFKRLEGHTRGVSSVAFLPDGGCIITGSVDCTIRVWDAYTGSLLVGPLQGHTGCVRSLSVSRDGGFIVSGSLDRTARKWDIKTGLEMFKPLTGPTDIIHSVTFSPDGSHIIVGTISFTIHTWNTSDGTPVVEPVQYCDGLLDTMVFSPDCTRFVCVSNNSLIQIWDMQRESQSVFEATSSDSVHSSESYEMITPEDFTDKKADSNISDALMTSTLEPPTRSSGHMISRQMSVQEMFLSLLEHGCDDLSLSINPNKYSSVAIAGGGFGDIWEGRMQDGTKVAIKCLRFHAIPPENKRGLKRAARELYVWSKAKHVNVQELSGIIMFQGGLGMVSPWMDNGNLQEYLQKFPDADRYQFCIQIANGVSYLHSIDMVHGDIKAINVLVSKEGIAKLNDFDLSILMDPTLCFSSTTNIGGGTLRWMAPELILGPEDESSPPTPKTTQTDVYALGMTMLEIVTGKVPYAECMFDRSIMNAIYKKKPPNRPPELIARNATTLEMAGDSPLLSTWTADAMVRSVSISPDGKQIVSGSSDNKLYIWDLKSGAHIAKPLEGHDGWIHSVAFSPNGKLIASGSGDRQIRVWDSHTGDLVSGPFIAHTRGVYSVAFSPDSTRIVSGSLDNTVYIWNVRTGDIVAGPLNGHTDGVHSVAFSPNDGCVASGSDDGTIRLWDAQTGTPMGSPFNGHTGGVRAVSFSPDGGRVASGSRDSTLRIWDLQSGKLIIEPLRGHTGWVCSVAFSPNGARLVSGSADETIQIWDSHTGAALTESFKGHASWVNSVAFSNDDIYVVSGSPDRTIRIWDSQWTSAVEGDGMISNVNRDADHSRSTNTLDDDGLEQYTSVAAPKNRDDSAPDVELVDVAVGPPREIEVVSGKMSASEMFECLLQHGCFDLSSIIDPEQYSSSAVAGGSFGDIWRGKTRNGIEVAVKALRFHVIAEDGAKGLKRAMRELYIWSKAKHENVHELMGIIMFQDRLGMVSPWMENGNLQEYIQKTPSVDRYKLCSDVAAGVEYLHGIGMVHGDLKAASGKTLNILVSHDGTAKLSDFDHSILSDCTLLFSSTTNVGGGTLRWMAPELLLRQEDDEDEEETDPSSGVMRNTQTDVYSLGMTMLEILTGKVPYSEYKYDTAILRALDRKQPPVRPKAVLGSDQRSDQMWSLMLECWDHDPAARPKARLVRKLVREFALQAASIT